MHAGISAGDARCRTVARRTIFSLEAPIPFSALAVVDHAEQVLSAALELVKQAPLDDTDSLFRGLVAVATLCHGDKETLALAKDLGLQVRPKPSA